MMGKSGVRTPLLNADIEAQTPRAGAAKEKGKAAKAADYVSLPGAASSVSRSQRPTLPGPAAPAAAEASSAASKNNSASLSTLLMIAVCCIATVIYLSAPFVAEPYDGNNPSQDDAKNAYYKASRTGYHFQPEKNFMNDPNGPMYYKGYYHIFYQYNPKGAVWGNICWGHAVSTDLVHWLYLELALVPDQWYDIEGVWSGSATILEDGTPALMYTGSRNGQHQSQSMAIPVDPSDPLLRKWKKVPENPLLLNPTGISPHDFRDPTTAWLESDGLWRITIGAKVEKTGIALLYTSRDFRRWELQDTWLHHVNATGMWECVDFYPVLEEGKLGVDHSILLGPKKEQLNAELGGEQPPFSDSFKYVFKVSLDDTRHDHYAIGTYSTATHKFVTDRPGIGPRYDYGKFYASKTFYDSKSSRRILWGWANESDSEQDDITKGWASVQALPRAIWLDAKTGSNILQWPVEEVDRLRGGLTSHDSTVLQPRDILKVKGGDGPQLDITVVFQKPDVSTVDRVIPDEEFDCSQGGSAHRGVFGPFGLLVLTDDNLIEHTAVFFYITPMKSGAWTTRVCSDQSRSSLAPNLDTTVYGSFVNILPTEDTLELRVLVDHSIVETFVQGGRLAITSRVYPTLAINEKSRLFLFNNGTRPITVKSVDVYQMSSVAMHAI
ncbi:hypothetical protein Mapa_006331 [Marchantia paleacea]|nr:hypothetical protein Mapa_006331 [Marchantia paleacea]